MLKFIFSAKTSVKLLVAILLLIFLHYTRILLPVENLIIRIFAPVQHQVYVMGSGMNNFYSNISSNKDLKAENDRLMKEVQELTIENSQLSTLIQIEAETTIQERFLQDLGLEAVTARVIGKNPEANLQAIILDKGSKDGVRIDQPLITSEGVIIGKIEKVRPNSSEALLINDPRSKIAAVIQNENESKGFVVGDHGLSLKMELIPQNEQVSIGDVIVTSGLEPSIARGLVVGKITRVETEANGFFQTAFLQSLVKIDNLTIVSILKSPLND